MSATSRHGLLLATSLLALACACDKRATEPDTQTVAEAEAPAEIAEEPEAGAMPARDLDQLEAELAANEAQLRQLGVAIGATTAVADGEAEPAPEAAEDHDSPAEPKQATAPKDRKAGKPTSKAGGAKAKKEDKPTNDGAGAGTRPRPDSGASGTKFTGGDDIMPEPAKAIPNPPTDRPTEQAEDRCPLICSLADSTCELTDEICELAERHADDDAYLQACERASGDCSQAREACLECVE